MRFLDPGEPTGSGEPSRARVNEHCRSSTGGTRAGLAQRPTLHRVAATLVAAHAALARRMAAAGAADDRPRIGLDPVAPSVLNDG